jgi:hypothetical protein
MNVSSTGATQETALHLRGVLDTALPHDLGTEDAPETYTVAAVFSRQVSREEQALIEDPATARQLAEHGYPGVELSVADRRLLIANTNLAMLEHGLAHEIAELLRGIHERLATERTRKAHELDAWRAAEVERATAIKAEADRVRFE